jgi:hypothetical protein
MLFSVTALIISNPTSSACSYFSEWLYTIIFQSQIYLCRFLKGRYIYTVQTHTHTEKLEHSLSLIEDAICMLDGAWILRSELATSLRHSTLSPAVTCLVECILWGCTVLPFGQPATCMRLCTLSCCKFMQFILNRKFKISIIFCQHLLTEILVHKGPRIAVKGNPDVILRVPFVFFFSSEYASQTEDEAMIQRIAFKTNNNVHCSNSRSFSTWRKPG